MWGDCVSSDDGEWIYFKAGKWKYTWVLNISALWSLTQFRDCGLIWRMQGFKQVLWSCDEVTSIKTDRFLIIPVAWIYHHFCDVLYLMTSNGKRLKINEMCENISHGKKRRRRSKITVFLFSCGSHNWCNHMLTVCCGLNDSDELLTITTTPSPKLHTCCWFLSDFSSKFSEIINLGKSPRGVENDNTNNNWCVINPLGEILWECVHKQIKNYNA